MRVRSMLVLSAAQSVFAQVLLAQEQKTHWSFSVGPTVSIARRPVAGSYHATCDTCASTETVIFNGKNGRYHAALGVSRALGGSSLVARGEALYSRSSSPPGKIPVFGYPGLDWRYALRDEVFVVAAVLEWDALPGRAFSPYLLTSVGTGVNRVSWNSDPASAQIDQQQDRVKLFRAVGAGVRVRAGRREWFIEWRSYRTLNDGGSTIVPFSLGIRF